MPCVKKMENVPSVPDINTIKVLAEAKNKWRATIPDRQVGSTHL